VSAGEASLPAGSVAVVTGATGFIGSALVDALVTGGVRVRCLTRARPTRSDAFAGKPVEWHVVDWTDERALDRSSALEGARAVFHLAATTKALSLEAFRAGNVRPTAMLLSTLVRRAERVDRFVCVSSQAAGGPATSLEAPRRELDAPAPIDAYGRSKLEAEQLVAAHGAQIPWTIVRPSSVYGPRDKDFLAVFKQVWSGIWIYPATRDRWLSIAYVDDVVRGILAAGSSAHAVGRLYYLTAEPPVSWREVYRAAAAASGARKFLELNLPQAIVDAAGVFGDIAARVTRRVGLVNSQKVALGRPRFWVCAGERAREELGVECSTPLAEGMRRAFEWYRAVGWL